MESHAWVCISSCGSNESFSDSGIESHAFKMAREFAGMDNFIGEVALVVGIESCIQSFSSASLWVPLLCEYLHMFVFSSTIDLHHRFANKRWRCVASMFLTAKTFTTSIDEQKANIYGLWSGCCAHFQLCRN